MVATAVAVTGAATTVAGIAVAVAIATAAGAGAGTFTWNICDHKQSVREKVYEITSDGCLCELTMPGPRPAGTATCKTKHACILRQFITFMYCQTILYIHTLSHGHPLPAFALPAC